MQPCESFVGLIVDVSLVCKASGEDVYGLRSWASMGCVGEGHVRWPSSSVIDLIRSSSVLFSELIDELIDQLVDGLA